MGWMETCAVDERMRFVMAVEQRRGGVCGGVPALRGEPAGPATSGLSAIATAGRRGSASTVRGRRMHHPQALTEAIAERCLAVRRAHPTWGPVKVRAWLRAARDRGRRGRRRARSERCSIARV